MEKLYRQVERESKNDQSNDRLYGLRVLLRYESSVVPTETARQMTAVLDQEFIRISQTLGCSAEERVIAIVQSRDAYRKSTDSAEWSGGTVRREDSRAGVRPEGSGSEHAPFAVA